MKVVTFESLNASGLINGFTTRYGGVSQPPYDSMNLGAGTNDTTESVEENFKILFDYLGVDRKHVAMTRQIHSDHIIVVDKIRDLTIYEDTDGLITSNPDVLLVTFYADCTPLYFYDERKKVIGLSHAGWRGTVNEIGRKTVEKMIETFGCALADIQVVIGPNIGKCHFEVSDGFLDHVDNGQKYKAYLFEKNDQMYFDLKEANRKTLVDFGIHEENIFVSEYCTFCNKDLFYSYRRDKSDAGRMAAFLKLRR